MGIILESQQVHADVAFRDGVLGISFFDPSYVRCESILINAENRHIGGILHEGYHDFGELPPHISVRDLGHIGRALLTGTLPSGQGISLSAPLQLSFV